MRYPKRHSTNDRVKVKPFNFFKGSTPPSAPTTNYSDISFEKNIFLKTRNLPSPFTLVNVTYCAIKR